MTANVAVLGGGAWGTAFAIHLATRAFARPRVTLYVRDAAQARVLAAERENRRYLPSVALPPQLAITTELAGLRADIVFAATPVAELATLCRKLSDTGLRAPFVSLAKGFVPGPADEGGWMLQHRVLGEGAAQPVAVVSGPSFAVEVAHGLPTAAVVASTDPGLTRDVGELVRADTFRVYASDDLVGVEVGGAVKNVFAIAAGTSDGLGFGDNARAALITRGLAEAGRLSAALGGRAQTLTGLAGLGDLVLTCTGNLSRNRRVGLALSRRQPLAAILAEIGHVAEGVAATRAARALAAHHRVDMPIVDAVHRVLYESVPPRDAVQALLAREPRDE